MTASAHFSRGGPGIGAAPDKPFLIMGGTTDSIATTESVRSAYDRQTAVPRRLVSLGRTRRVYGPVPDRPFAGWRTSIGA